MLGRSRTRTAPQATSAFADPEASAAASKPLTISRTARTISCSANGARKVLARVELDPRGVPVAAGGPGLCAGDGRGHVLAAELARSSDHITAFARYHDRLASFLRSSKMQRKGWAWRSRRRIGYVSYGTQ